jgi:hypothetical protein
MYPKSEILFPRRCLPSLRRMRGPKWQDLVSRVARLPEDHVDSLALSLLMIRLCNCLKCDLGSYKASLGCCACAQRALSGFKSSDAALLRRADGARRRVIAYLESRGIEPVMDPPSLQHARASRSTDHCG